MTFGIKAAILLKMDFIINLFIMKISKNLNKKIGKKKLAQLFTKRKYQTKVLNILVNQ